MVIMEKQIKEEPPTPVLVKSKKNKTPKDKIYGVTKEPQTPVEVKSKKNKSPKDKLGLEVGVLKKEAQTPVLIKSKKNKPLNDRPKLGLEFGVLKKEPHTPVLVKHKKNKTPKDKLEVGVRPRNADHDMSDTTEDSDGTTDHESDMSDAYTQDSDADEPTLVLGLDGSVNVKQEPLSPAASSGSHHSVECEVVKEDPEVKIEPPVLTAIRDPGPLTVKKIKEDKEYFIFRFPGESFDPECLVNNKFQIGSKKKRFKVANKTYEISTFESSSIADTSAVFIPDKHGKLNQINLRISGQVMVKEHHGHLVEPHQFDVDRLRTTNHRPPEIKERNFFASAAPVDEVVVSKKKKKKRNSIEKKSSLQIEDNLLINQEGEKLVSRKKKRRRDPEDEITSLIPSSKKIKQEYPDLW